MTAVLRIDRLSVSYPHHGGTVAAVREVSLGVDPSECVGIVGESGSGKTQMCMAAMGLAARGARIEGSIRFEGRELIGAPDARLNEVRGSKLTMVFQDPMSSLTPHLKIGVQLAEVLVQHRRMSWRDATHAALQALERVQIPQARRRLGQYPHELSGGLRQRVMIGMGLLCEPSLLIADEPTTALDVTVQSHVVELLRSLRRTSDLAILLVTHDLAMVAGLADRIVVMYGGRVVESGRTQRIVRHPAHPYTAELLKCVPDMSQPRLERMATLPGQPPDPREPEVGCSFAPRCSRAGGRCRAERPMLQGEAAAVERVACHFPLDS